AAEMEISANLPSSEVCYFCKERVYLLQRLSAEGLFFHRSCFKCEYCSASLRLGNYSFDRDAICGGKFYCIPHFRMQKPENRHMEIMKRKQEFLTRAFEEEKEKLYKTLLDNTEKALSPGKQLTDKASESVTDSPKTPDAQKQDNVQKSTNLLTEPSSTFGCDQTPERVEYENSIIELSEEELLTSELEEEELTQKNLGPSQDLATSEDEYSDLSTDTESDEEAFAEELERSLTADETRKLAETWNRKYSAEHSLIDTVSSSADDEGSDTEIGSEDTSDDVDSNAEYSLDSSEEECDQAEKEEEKLLSVDAKDEFTVQVPVIDLKSINRISEDETSSESDISEEETDEDEDSEGESESGTEVDSESEPKALLPPPLIPKIIIHESPPQDIDLDQEWEVETPSLQNDNSVHDTPLCDDSVVILNDSTQNNPLCDDSVVILSDSAQNNELELSVEIVESVPKHPDTSMAVAENYDASSYKDADGKSNQNDTAKNLDYSQFRTEEEITCQVKEKVIAPLATEESSSDLSVSSGINSLAKEIASDVLNAAKDSISKQKSSMHLYGLKIFEPSSCAFSDSTQHSEKTSFSDSWMILSSSTSEEAKVKLIDLTSSDQPNDKVEVHTIITPVSNNVEIIDLCSPSDLNTEDRFTVVSPRDQTNDSDLVIHSKGDDDHNHSVPNEDYISSSPLDSNLLKEKDVEEKFDFQIETEDTEVIAKSIFLDDSMEDIKEISMFDEYLDNSPENAKFDSANVTLRKKRRFSCEGEGFNWDSDNSISLPHCYGEEESCISVDEIEKKMEHTTDGVYHADVVQAIQIEGTENNNQEAKVTKSGKEIKKLSFEICSDKASEFQNTKDYQLCSSLSQSLPNSSSYLKHDSTFQTSTPYNFYSFEDAKHSAPVPKRTMTPDRPELSAEIRYEKFSEHESVKENLSFSTSEMNVIDSDVSELQNKLKQETPESISPKADTKYKGYSGSFAEKVRPKSLFCDTIYLRSLDINLQKQPFSSLNKSNDKLDECNKTETADGIRRKLFTESPSLSKSEDELDEYRIEYENQIKQNLINKKSELSYPSDKYYAKTEIEQNRLVLETSSVADDKLSPSRLKSSAVATENSNKSVDIGISKSKISSHKHSSVSFSAPESCNDLVSPYTYAQARPLFENKFPTKMRPKCDMDIIKLKQKREKRKSVHEDIQGLPFADEEKLISPVEPLDACDVFLTPKTSNRKISDSNSSSAPAWKTPDLIDEERYLRLQSTVDQEKARQEARARARLKSDEELGLSPNNYRKKYTRQLSLNSINYDELCSDEFCDQDDELEDEIISNFCQTKSSGIEETFNMFKKNSLYLKTKNPELALASSHQPAQSKEKILPSNCDREIPSNTNIPQPVDMAVPICLLDSVMKEVVVSKKLGDYESEGNLSKSKEMLQPSKHSNQSSSSETSPEIFTSEGTFDSKITNKGKSKASRAESSGDDDKSKSNGKKSIFSILNFGKTHVSREKVKQKSKDSEKDFSSAAATDICNRINSKSKPFSHLKLAKSKEKISKPKAKPVPADSSFVSPTENSQEDTSNVSFNEQQAKIIPKYTVYRNPETTISSFPVHLPIPKLENGLAPKASEDSFSDEDETQGSKAGHIPNTEKNDKNSTEKDNKTLRMVQKVQRQQVLKRLRSAQEIQRRLEELEIKQKELEQQGVEVEKMFRREGHGSDSKEEAELMQKWYTLIHSKNKLTREEQELVIRLKDLELEDRHSKLQQTLRERLAQNSDKTEVQIMEERKILAEMLEIVEKRDELVAMLEQLRLREVEEEKNVTTEVFSKGMKSPLSPGEKS
ncbi:uncharacterized protein LOC118183661, partial [Stegodyphus dumicola]|uniref:uncharacterized protein LOC118183661 n=1 Tax=Stegodyphus dumicola TaxID=202533 RepID=UPI0015AFA2F0